MRVRVRLVVNTVIADEAGSKEGRSVALEHLGKSPLALLACLILLSNWVPTWLSKWKQMKPQEAK